MLALCITTLLNQHLDQFCFSNSIAHLGKQKAFCIMQDLVFGYLE